MQTAKYTLMAGRQPQNEKFWGFVYFYYFSCHTAKRLPPVTR
jgi:hypothetical protein